MANIMSQKNVRNKVHRNGFDLSFRNSFTAKVGELLPVMCKEVIPGDRFDIDVSSFTRTQPVNSAAFSRLREYYDFYFVPYSLLWDKFPSFIVQTGQPYHTAGVKTSAKVDEQPYISSKMLYQFLLKLNYDTADGDPAAAVFNNEVGFNRLYGTCKLLSYLGYGDTFANVKSFNLPDAPNPDSLNWDDFVDIRLNPFPIMAYQKIYQDFFRFSQWEQPAPWTYNVDYLMAPTQSFNIMDPSNSGSYKGFYQNFYDADVNNKQFVRSLFDLNYCNFKKDLFMGILPSPQFGDTAVAAPITGTFTGVASYHNEFTNDGTVSPSGVVARFSGKGLANLVAQEASGNKAVPFISIQSAVGSGLVPDRYNTAGISIFALRQAEFLQKWKEITNSGSLDYREQIQKHWGVTPDRSESYLCRWLGGTSGTITINEVVNQNLSSASDTASLFGKAAGSVNGHISETFNQYGILMCIYHCEPVLDWAHIGLDRLNTKTQVGDYAIPEFDSLGMEALPPSDLVFTQSKLDLSVGQTDTAVPVLLSDFLVRADSIIGYVPRYIDYKTSYDQINGDFLYSMSHWVNPLTYTEILLKFLNVESFEDFSTRVTYTTFKVSPSIVNSIFAVNADSTLSSDCLLIGSFFDIKAVRNLSTDGLPY